jgi:L-ascorbate metabolism protein UlaG (beta-lactamase superfamily)
MKKMKNPLKPSRIPGLRAAASMLDTTCHWGPRLARTFINEFGVRVMRPNHQPNPAEWSDSSITIAWLGPASVLINFFGLHIITDPVLARRIGASIGKRTIGPKRLIAPALTVKQLPPIDLILLSHAHLDHFHVATLKQFAPKTRVVTASQTKDLLAKTKLKDVHELQWGERITFSTPHGEITIEAFEVSHWGARWRHDKHRGFNGYILERNHKKLLFGGDTGYCPLFKKLKSKGPFDLAIMPIGSYKAGEFCWHCTPEEAIEMANDAGANYILPIHHMTFNFGKDIQNEPIERFKRALSADRIGWHEVGETFTL